jgi:hypothetical protein
MKAIRRSRAAALVAGLAAAGLAASPAQAVLGGDASSVAADNVRLNATRHQVSAMSAQVGSHEITLADGSSIREYTTPGGIVFAVAWSTRFKPDLASLLGQHAGAYAAAASEAMKAPGIRRHVELQRGDLVVQSGGRLNAFVGKAWLRSLVPEGVNVDALR